MVYSQHIMYNNFLKPIHLRCMWPSFETIYSESDISIERTLIPRDLTKLDILVPTISYTFTLTPKMLIPVVNQDKNKLSIDGTFNYTRQYSSLTDLETSDSIINSSNHSYVFAHV